MTEEASLFYFMENRMPAPVNKPRIFVVEDEMIVARDIEMQLVQLGYDPVGHASEGKPAIKLVGELRPDLVLMDVKLAGAMDGIVAAQAIRTQFSLPVVFLTAFAEEDTLARAKLTEPFGYVLKPFSESELRSVIEIALYKHKTEEKLRVWGVALGSVSQGIIVTGPDFCILSVNDAFLSITGYSEAEVAGRNCEFLQGPLTDRRVVESIRLALKNVTAFSGEILNYRKDGSTFWNELTISPVRGREGQLTHFLGVIRDITLRKRGEAALIESEERFRRMVNSIPVGLGVVDREGRTLMVNESLQKQFGYALEELVGQPFDLLIPHRFHSSVVFRLNADPQKPAVRPVEQGLGLFGRRKEGSEFPVEICLKPFQYPEGMMTLAVITDSTERRQVEGALRTAEKLAATGRMAAQIAHEINNPLGGIRNAFSLIKESIPPETKNERWMGMIDREIDRMARIVRQMFDMYGTQPEKPKEVVFDRIITEVIDLMRSAAVQRGVTIVSELAPNPMHCLQRSGSIFQILYNLLANALEASPLNGKVIIHLHSAEAWVVIKVSDQGDGIPPDVQGRIFDPFFSTKTGVSGSGMGLGLAVARGLAESMGGTLEFETKPGSGTTFSLRIPVVIPQPRSIHHLE